MDEATIFSVFIGFMGAAFIVILMLMRAAFIVILMLMRYFEKKWDRENR